MIDLDTVLREQPVAEPPPFFARRVMHAIRQPRPLRFPWRRAAIAAVAAVSAIGAVASADLPPDPVLIAGVLIAAATAGIVERIVTA